MTKKITLVVELNVLPGKMSALRELSKHLDKRHAERSPGIIGFDYYIDEGTQSGRLVEIYKSAEAMTQHFGQNAKTMSEVSTVYTITAITVLGTLPDPLAKLISATKFEVATFPELE